MAFELKIFAFLVRRAAHRAPLASSVRTQRLQELPVLLAHTALESKQCVPLVPVEASVQIHRKNRLFALQENTAMHLQLLALIVYLGTCVKKVVL